MRKKWTVAGSIPMTIDEDFYKSCISLTNREAIENTLATLHRGRAVFPFIAAIYVGLTSENFLAYFVMPLLVGIFSVLNHLFQDDFVVMFFRYLFALFQMITLRLGFIATPIIISIYHKSPMFAIAFILSFTSMWLFYLITDAIYRSYIKSKYKKFELTDDEVISLWDRKCLTKLYGYHRWKLGFSDYLTFYFERLTAKRPIEICGYPEIAAEQRRSKEAAEQAAAKKTSEPAPEEVMVPKPDSKFETTSLSAPAPVITVSEPTTAAQIATEEDAEKMIQTPPVPEPEPLQPCAPISGSISVSVQIQAEEARYHSLETEIRKIPAKKVKEWHAEGKITDEQFMQIAKKYNKLRAEMRDIRERIEVLKQIENSPEE